MKNSYPKITGHVKATYFIRFNGRSLRIRASHMEMIQFLRSILTQGQPA